MRIEFARFVTPVVIAGRTNTFLTEKMCQIELTESFLLEIRNSEKLLAIVPLHNVAFLIPSDEVSEDLNSAVLSVPESDGFQEANDSLFIKRGPGRPRKVEANGRVGA